MLLPIKRQLAATDDLIDKIVYKLYGLTDEEIEIVERPAYEQALADAKSSVLRDEKLQADPDAATNVIASAVMSAAKRLQGQLALTEERKLLDADLPSWHLFPDEVVTFLLTGEYNIRVLPESLDFSTSVISYSKAVEAMLSHRLFMPFRAELPSGRVRQRISSTVHARGGQTDFGQFRLDFGEQTGCCPARVHGAALPARDRDFLGAGWRRGPAERCQEHRPAQPRCARRDAEPGRCPIRPRLGVGHPAVFVIRGGPLYNVATSLATSRRRVRPCRKWASAS